VYGYQRALYHYENFFLEGQPVEGTIGTNNPRKRSNERDRASRLHFCFVYKSRRGPINQSTD